MSEKMLRFTSYVGAVENLKLALLG